MPIVVVIAGVLIVVTAFGYSYLSNNREPVKSEVPFESGASTTPNRNETGMMMENMPEGMGVMMVYRNGVYKKSVPYSIPYGYVEPMEVSLTIADGIVTDSRVEFKLGNPTSKPYQEGFLDYYQNEIIGKPLDDINFSRLGGASLTNMAFDVAVVNIKMEASGMEQMPTVSNPVQKYNEDTIFADGEYVIDDNYVVNSFLSEPIKTTITLADGVIVDSKVSFLSPDQISKLHQDLFIEQYKVQIIGRPIYSASVARIGSASLTTEAFNKALESIRDQAQS